MGRTITEKILARAAGRDEVAAGEIVEARVDLALANDITAPLAMDEFEKAGFTKVFDPARIALVPDHFTPNKDIKTAGQVKRMREFARRHGIAQFFETGRVGIEHVILPDMGFVAPGDLVIGADSHTCTYGAVAAFSTGVGSTDFAAAMAWGRVWLRVPETIRFVYHGRQGRYVVGKDLMLHTIGLIGVDGALYKAMEFAGEAIESLSMEGRFTMCNMAIEAGGKSGIVGFDEKTTSYLQGRPEGSRARSAGRSSRATPTPPTPRSSRSTPPPCGRRWRGRTCRRTRHRRRTSPTSGSTRSWSARAPTAASPTCSRRPGCCAGARCIPTCVS